MDQFYRYAKTCLNAHIGSMVLKQKGRDGLCDGLDPYLKDILQHASMEYIAPLLNTRDFRDLLTNGCNGKIFDYLGPQLSGPHSTLLSVTSAPLLLKT